MSLKRFHLFFIACTLGLMSFIGYWSWQQAQAGQPRGGAAVCAAAGFIMGLGYLRWFLKKYRALT